MEKPESLSRRDVAKAAGAASLPAAAPDEVRFGPIGTGSRTALCDIDPEHLDRSAKTIITTPLFMHFPIVKDALPAGRHVFCEKSLLHRDRGAGREAEEDAGRTPPSREQSPACPKTPSGSSAAGRKPWPHKKFSTIRGPVAK